MKSDLYPKRIEFAKVAALRKFGAVGTVDVRSKWDGGATSIFIIALSAPDSDVNEVYAVIASDEESETKVIHVDTED